MPDIAPLRLHCPECGSNDIVYTCEPSCCFNHVCTACRAVFYPSTAATGRTRADLLTGERQARGPISRTTLCKLSGAAANSQRNYERRARVGRRSAIAIGPLRRSTYSSPISPLPISVAARWFKVATPDTRQAQRSCR